MILELTAAAAALGVVVLAARRIAARRGAAPPDSGAEGAPEPGAPLAVGDVLLHGAEELWLAGALVLREGDPVLTLFRTPGATTEWLAMLDARGEALARLSPFDVFGSGPPPAELRWEGHRLKLVRRGRARVEPEGEMLPPFGREGSYVLLESVGGRVAAVLDGGEGERLALLGRRVDRGGLERLPGERAGEAQAG